VAISNGGQCPQLNSGLGTSHGWLSSMWIESSDTLIHALGYNTTLFAGQSEGWYVLILVPKKLEDLETFNAVLQRGARPWGLVSQGDLVHDPKGQHLKSEV
jgi:hypothetical protein